MSSVFGKIHQVGFMSRDIDRSIQYFVEAWGVGPWYVMRNVAAPMIYQRERTDLEISIAMANCDDLQFEIVMQHNDAPSLYRDALAHTSALHIQHVASWVGDIAGVEADAQAKGWSSIFETAAPPGRSVFLTHPDEPAVCIELSDCDPFKNLVRAAIREAAASWDGGEPIRNGLPDVKANSN